MFLRQEVRLELQVCWTSALCLKSNLGAKEDRVGQSRRKVVVILFIFSIKQSYSRASSPKIKAIVSRLSNIIP